MMPTLRPTTGAVLVATAGALALGCGAPPPPADEPALAGGVVTQWTDSTELFMEHPALIVGADGVFAVHLTRLSDFAALATGPVIFRFAPRDGGEPVVVVQEAPRAPGIFGPRPVFPRAGTWDLSIEVASADLQDTLAVPGLVVYADTAGAPIDEEGGDDGISFLKEQAWKTPGFLTASAAVGRITEVREVPASLEMPAAGIARITAPLAGILSIAGSAMPIAGQSFRAGATLAHLTPLIGDAGSGLAQARAELRRAEAEFERAGRLVAAEVAPRRRRDDAAIQLDAARESLRAFGDATTEDGRLAIRTPIGGTISESQLVAGARVAAGDPLATVVATERLWLEARIPSDIAAQLRPGGRVTFRIGDNAFEAGPLVGIAPGIDSLSRTVAGRWSVPNPDGRLRFGTLVVASLPIAAVDSGVVIPPSAVLDDDGQAIAFVQVGGESFERRLLTLGARGVDRVVVRAGIAAGERVVTGAANQVRLASLSTAVPAHGHEH